MRVGYDLRAWARGVRVGTHMRWGYKGIDRPDWKDLGHKHYRRQNPGEHPLVHSLITSENYTQRLWEAEVKHLVESDDYVDEWREYCEDRCHNFRRCPSETPEEYKEAVEEMFNDEDERYRWANDRLEWDWVLECTSNIVEDDESVLWFLKEHPVEEVYSKVENEWYDLDEVLGYCFECDEPCTKAHLVKIGIEDMPDPHFFNPECCVCPAIDSDDNIVCLFNYKEERRLVVECPNCRETFVGDDIQTKQKRPFNWPPGIPYPAYWSFSGDYLNAPIRGEP